MAHLILLNGPPGVGKTTLADFLVAKGAKKIVLNRPFTEFVRDSLGISDEQMKAGKDHILQELGFKAPIRSAQIAAADAVEMIDPTVWVRRYFEESGMMFNDSRGFEDGVYVLDALGKQEQYNWIDANVAVPSSIVRIVRRTAVDKDSMAEASCMHPYVFSDGRHHCVGSGPNILFDNDGSLTSLEEEANRLMEKFS